MGWTPVNREAWGHSNRWEAVWKGMWSAVETACTGGIAAYERDLYAALDSFNGSLTTRCTV